MRLSPTLAACAVLAAAALALPAGASAASCAPQTRSYADAANDGELLQAPEITAITATVQDNCAIVLGAQIANRASMGANDQLQWRLDTDNNPATGLTNGPFQGTDYTVVEFGDGHAELFDVNRHSMGLLPSAGPFGAAFPIEAVGATNTSAMRIMALALTDYPSAVQTYLDFAPEPGGSPFVLQLQPGAPPAPAPTPTPTPAPTPTPTPTPTPAVQCVVPNLKGLTVTKARTALTAAHCALGKVSRHRGKGKPGRIVASSPRAGASAPAGTKVSVIVRPKHR